MNSLGINDVDNEVLNDADQYLRQHKILELFEVSCPSDSQIHERAQFADILSIKALSYHALLILLHDMN